MDQRRIDFNDNNDNDIINRLNKAEHIANNKKSKIIKLNNNRNIITNYINNSYNLNFSLKRNNNKYISTFNGDKKSKMRITNNVSYDKYGNKF